MVDCHRDIFPDVFMRHYFRHFDDPQDLQAYMLRQRKMQGETGEPQRPAEHLMGPLAALVKQ